MHNCPYCGTELPTERPVFCSETCAYLWHSYGPASKEPRIVRAQPKRTTRRKRLR